jgi:hypothetical protein
VDKKQIEENRTVSTASICMSVGPPVMIPVADIADRSGARS